MMEVTKTVEYERYPVYVDSGVEWIGEIPEGWGVRRGSYIFEKIDIRSKDGTEELLSVSEHHGVRPRSISNVTMFLAESYKGYKLCFPGDLVINSLWAWSRGLAISKYKGIVSTAYSVFRPNFERYNAGFLNALLRTDKYVAQYLIASKGVWISRLQLSDWAFLRLPIISPPLPDQIRIAAFLDRKTAQIDQAIAQKERLIELLKERKQIMIQQAVTRGLNPDVPMKDSGVEWIGEIPEGWEVVRNRSLFRERNDNGKQDLPILSVSIHSAVSSKELEDEENIRGKVRIEDKSNYKLVEPEDIVYNMMRAWQGAIGSVSIEGMVSPAYIVATPNEKIHSEYFENQYRSPIFIQQMNRFSRGITDFRKRLYWNEFKHLVTILPPLSEQKEISKFIAVIVNKIDFIISRKVIEIHHLKELKSTLINSAVTGKIKV